MLKKTTLPAAILAISMLFAAEARADSFTQSYSGTLASTTSIFQQNIALTSPSNLIVNTTSYAGGGFQPSLTLYTSGGNYLASQGVSNSQAVPDSTTGLALDSLLSRSNLGAGTYILVLTNWLYQQPPTATNLSSGFTNYGGNTFTDASGNLRNGNYAVTVAVSAAGPTATPEPMSLGLIPLGIGAMLMARRRLGSTRTGEEK